MEELIERIEAKAAAFVKAAEIMKSQLPFKEKIWLQQVDKHVGNDVVKFVKDIEGYKATSTSDSTTWGTGSKKGDKRRAGNTMGYHYTG